MEDRRPDWATNKIGVAKQWIEQTKLVKTPIVSTDVGISTEVLHPSSIYEIETFESAKPNINFAYERAKNFVIKDGMNKFNEMMVKLYES